MAYAQEADAGAVDAGHPPAGGPAGTGAGQPERNTDERNKAPECKPVIAENSGWLVFLYVLLLVAFPAVIVLYDMRKTYERQSATGIGAGIAGVARTTIALTILIVLGLSVAHLLVYRCAGDDGTVKQILTMLATALSSITGFYFGGKTATESATKPTSPPAAATIVEVKPTHATPGEVVEIRGTNFGTDGVVTFADISVGAEPNGWSPTLIKVKVPTGKLGRVSIGVNPIDGVAGRSASLIFTIDQ
jgi:hypothetical protein